LLLALSMTRMILSAVTLLVITGLGVRASAQNADNLACYAVKDSAKGSFTFSLTNAGATQTCSVKLPAKFGCTETQVSGVTPTPHDSGPSPGAAGNFLCYKLRCPRPFPPSTQTTDQFGGQRVVKFRSGQFLCAPSTSGPMTVGSTSTTTTTSPGSCAFDNGSRTCTGSCGGGGHCSAVASGGACECRTTTCGDASAPSCDGFCASDEACIFLVTGCKCQGIP
jgi:hypothetical protein